MLCTSWPDRSVSESAGQRVNSLGVKELLAFNYTSNLTSLCANSAGSLQLVDVRGITKGKGFQGVMKKWNFK
jgi:ribosomal protein L3